MQPHRYRLLSNLEMHSYWHRMNFSRFSAASTSFSYFLLTFAPLLDAKPGGLFFRGKFEPSSPKGRARKFRKKQKPWKSSPVIEWTLDIPDSSTGNAAAFVLRELYTDLALFLSLPLSLCSNFYYFPSYSRVNNSDVIEQFFSATLHRNSDIRLITTDIENVIARTSLFLHVNDTSQSIARQIRSDDLRNKHVTFVRNILLLKMSNHRVSQMK